MPNVKRVTPSSSKRKSIRLRDLDGVEEPKLRDPGTDVCSMRRTRNDSRAQVRQNFKCPAKQILAEYVDVRAVKVTRAVTLDEMTDPKELVIALWQ